MRTRGSVLEKFVLVIVAIPCIYLVGCVAWYLISTNQEKQALKRLPNAAEVAEACRGLLESIEGDSSFSIDRRGESVYVNSETGAVFDLPAVLEELDFNYMTVDPQQVRLEFHGGHDHYGLRLRPPEPGSTTTCTWVLSYYDELMSRELYVLP